MELPEDFFNLIELPQSKKEWFLTWRRLNTKSELLPVSYETRILLALVDIEDEILLKLDILDQEPDQGLITEFLFEAMNRPEPASLSDPQRPQMLWVEEGDLVDVLSSELQKIQVPVTQAKPDQSIEEILSGLEVTFSFEAATLPGLLSVPGFNFQDLQRFCATAADFYRAAPWLSLSDFQPLSVTIDPPGDQMIVQIMGQAGLEYGLVYYNTWTDLEQFYQKVQDPLAHIPDSGWHSLTFEPVDSLPEDDLLAFKTYECEIVGEDAYPMPLVYTPNVLLRPTRDELLTFEIIMHVIPGFLVAHLTPDDEGDYLPQESQSSLLLWGQNYQVMIKYPANTSINDQSAYFSYMKDQQNREDHGFDLDFRIVTPERTESDFQLVDLFSGKDEKSILDPLTRARRMIHVAWEQENPEEKIAMAQQALKISSDCPEAYILLAEEFAEDAEQACQFFRDGMQVAERLLGEVYFEEHKGEFWRLKETRPYMRARMGMADCLVAMSETEEALTHYLEILSLNPDDDQGVRYAVMPLLLRKGEDQKVWEILQNYQDDSSAAWYYNRALLAFRSVGDSDEARRFLREAVKHNPYVPDLLLGRKPIPVELPAFVGYGDESEAVHYAMDHFQIWWSTKLAIEWLKKQSSNQP